MTERTGMSLRDVVNQARRTYLHIVFFAAFAEGWQNRDHPMLRYDGGFQGTFTDA